MVMPQAGERETSRDGSNENSKVTFRPTQVRFSSFDQALVTIVSQMTALTLIEWAQQEGTDRPKS